MRRLRSTPIWLPVLVVVVVVAAAAFRARPADVPSAIARESTFAETVVETGLLSAARMTIYSAPPGPSQSKILEIVSEGTVVQAGDRLIRFDTTAIEQDLARERAARRGADADRVRAIDDFKVEQLRQASDVALAGVRVESAEQALADEVDGRGRVTLAEADAAAVDTAREAERARKAVVDLQPLLERGFVTRAELERAEQTARRAETASRLAAMRAEAIASFQRPAAIAKLRAEAGIARDAVSRQGEIAAARAQQAESGIPLAETRVAEIDARIAALQASIAASTVAAQGPGLVIYRDVYFGADRRKPQVGDAIAPNQPLIAVPDTSRLVVETRVREIDVTRVAAGRRAVVRADALPDTSVAATVTLVGALALEDPGRTGTRFFPVTAAIDRADPRLRPGMTARIEIASTSVPRAVIVPLQAVFDRDGERYCVVLDRGRWIRRVIALAGVNETEAAIAAGVLPGDRVALADPDAGR